MFLKGPFWPRHGAFFFQGCLRSCLLSTALCKEATGRSWRATWVAWFGGFLFWWFYSWRRLRLVHWKVFRCFSMFFVLFGVFISFLSLLVGFHMGPKKSILPKSRERRGLRRHGVLGHERHGGFFLFPRFGLLKGPFQILLRKTSLSKSKFQSPKVLSKIFFGVVTGGDARIWSKHLQKANKKNLKTPKRSKIHLYQKSKPLKTAKLPCLGFICWASG